MNGVVSFPCLVKVDMSWSGNGNHLARNKNELSAILRKIRDECGWKHPVLYQELIEGIKEVPSITFYLHKSGEIYWIGTAVTPSITSSVVDWDRQQEYHDLVYEQFTVPIKDYLHKAGFFGLFNYEVMITDHGMYLVDLNPRFSWDTTHLLSAPYMAQLGLKHSKFTIHNKTSSSAKTVVETANDINETNEGRVIITSAADLGDGNAEYESSVFAKSPEQVQALYDKLTYGISAHVVRQQMD